MKFYLNLLFIFFCLDLVPTVATAQLPSRDVSLEWEEIREAASYEIEIQAQSTPERPAPRAQLYSTHEPIWAGQLSPGYYRMRVRSKDHRRVPGDWSEWMDVTVLLAPPVSSRLKEKLKVESRSTNEVSHLFTWDPVPGANSYQLQIRDRLGVVIFDQEVRNNEIEVPLPVARELTWELRAKAQDGLVSENSLKGEIETWGPPLANVEIETPRNGFVRELKWRRPSYAEVVDYSLQIRDPRTRKWKTIESKKASDEERITFPSTWPGGQYRLSLRAQASRRKTSKVTSLVFRVENGDRSEEAEYFATLRQSIIRPAGWFLTASYLVTGMQYHGVNADNGGAAPLQVDMPDNFGGTGRIGLGYLSDRRPWGFIGIADLSGFRVLDQNPTFATFETNAVYRMVVGERGELRQQMGLFYKEIPELIARNLQQIERIDKIVAAGPHYGFEYWWALTPTLGFQVNAHLYASSISIRTPTGNPVTQSLSYQTGLLGSYRINAKISGLLGYAYRRDSQSYQSQGTRQNSVDITGHYLNLLLEWAL